MNTKKIYTLIRLLCASILISACSKASADSWYVDGDSKYEKRELIEPYETIKKDFYQQVIVDNNITKESEFPWGERVVVFKPETERYITYNSIFLLGFYGIYEDAYVCDFIINHQVYSGWFNLFTTFEVNGVKYGGSSGNVAAPYVWKDGVIYEMQEAVDANVLTEEWVIDHFNEGGFISLPEDKVVEGCNFHDYILRLPSFVDGHESSYDPDDISFSPMTKEMKKVKKKFFKKYFYDKGVNDDREFNKYFVPRLVEPRSILVDGYTTLGKLKILIIDINEVNTVGTYKEYYGVRCHLPREHMYALYNGDILTLDEAYEQELFTKEELENSVLNIANENPKNEWIYFTWPNIDFFNNLPGLNRN